VQELVDLQRYLTVSMKDTVPLLMTRIVTATQRVLFLLDSTILLKEDIQLNTRVFHWPKGLLWPRGRGGFDLQIFVT
jgi:hypothetical protein